MPKIIGYTPPWLSRPSPGARIFSDPAPQSPASPSKRTSSTTSLSQSSTGYRGPRRLIANRGSEIFTVVGNKIRWADLAKVRDDWEEESQSRDGKPTLDISGKDTADNAAYRTLSTPVYYQIRQLVISPSGCFLAICTEHTVHVAILPDASRLADHDRESLKLKTYQLGPTTHVIPESPLTNVLWHPLAVATHSTDCLVTVTAEAAVRVWEIDRANQWSFERPAIAIDMRKLADGTSCDQDFEPSGFGKNRGFSVDDFDMEVAAACFGGRGHDSEDAWASMTLWTAMKNGDVYALCPLLPFKWQPTSTTIPSLSISAVSRMATIVAENVDADSRRAANQQYEWVQEIDNDEPLIHESSDDTQAVEVRVRPQNPSAIPRLQGPFEVEVHDENIDDEMEVTDLFVFPAQLDENDLLSGEVDFDEQKNNISSGIPFTSICLATVNGQIYITVDLVGVSGQWLPKKGRNTFDVPLSETRQLTLVETYLAPALELSWPTFTSDPVHSHSIFYTSGPKIYSMSINDWVLRVAADLSGDEDIDPGIKTRLDTACQDQICLVEEVVSTSEQVSDPASCPIILDDIDLGYFLLTCSSQSVYGVFFDYERIQTLTAGASPELSSASPVNINNQLLQLTENEQGASVEPLPTRSPYAPPNIFYENSSLPLEQLRQRLPPTQRRVLAESPTKLSPVVLDIMTSAHRTVAKQTADLESAAAELFRRCDRLREELKDQIKQMTELADRLQHLRGSSDERSSEKKSHEARITMAKEKQTVLLHRYEAVRRKASRAGTANQELTPKEVGWIEEIDLLADSVGGQEDTGFRERATVALSKRYQTVKQLSQDLLEESKRLDKLQAIQSSQSSHPSSPQKQVQDTSPSKSKSSSLGRERSDSATTTTSSRRGGNGLGAGFSVSSRFQKEKIADVMAMVEREAAVIEAVMARLERLNV